MKKIIIAGGTGFIGLSLANFLAKKGYEPVLMARKKLVKNNDFAFVKWNGYSFGDWVSSLNNAYAIVNLAGKTVDCLKTPDNCDLILRSRVDSTLIIGKALKSLENPPKIWIQMATAHIYGDPPSQICYEDSTFGYGLAPIVGKAWEEAFLKSKPENIRGVRLRTSFVIGKNGGALASLMRIVKLGLGGKVSHGNQGMSWIHEYDMNNLILTSIENETYQGVYIASSPHPESNKDFMKKLRKEMKTPIGLPTPKWMTKFGAKYIFKTDPDLVLYGRYVKSKRLEIEAFEFKYPTLDKALRNLLKKTISIIK